MSKRAKIFIATLCTILILLALLHIWVPRPLFSTPTSTVLTSNNGTLIGAQIAADQQWRFPETDSISNKLSECIIAFEDQRFRYHWGIDPISVARAALHNIRSGHISEGGSTITMQLARMARGNQSRTIFQKIIEALWAIDIELTYSKDEILCLYASHAPFGGNTVGIEAAAWRYFGCDAKNLSWAENAMLSVLPNSPSLIHIGRNRDVLKQKRDHLLQRLANNGIIQPDECELYMAEPLPDKPYRIPNNAPQLLAQISKQHASALTQTTIDAHLQERVQQLANRYSGNYKSNYIDDIAVIVAEVSSGNVIAYVGNSSQQTPTSDVDNIQSERSTGSLLKPILYAAMLTNGDATPQMIFADTPLMLNGYAPQNFSKTYTGCVHANEAVTRSLNVPLIRMLSKYSTGHFISVLQWLGMTTLHYTPDHYGASIILGGAEGTLWDMAGMYASLSRVLKNYPTYNNQYNTADIHPLRLTPQPNATPTLTNRLTISASAIWQAYEAMSALNRPEEEADWQMFSSMKRIAWKTGTSWGGRDAWAIGTTPKYVVGVWVGNATGEGRANLTGVGFASPLMFDIFSLLPDSEWFSKPLDDMNSQPICKHSGHIASAICPDVDTLLIPRQCENTPVCNYCRLIHLTADGKWQVNSTCENINNIHTEARFILPPSQEYYFRKHSATYKPLPPMRPDCDMNTSEQISIITPEHGSTIVIPRNFSGEKEKIVMKAASHSVESTLYWHLDGTYIGQTTTDHQLAISPTTGQHTLTLIDDNGNRKTIIFYVK